MRPFEAHKWNICVSWDGRVTSYSRVDNADKVQEDFAKESQCEALLTFSCSELYSAIPSLRDLIATDYTFRAYIQIHHFYDDMNAALLNDESYPSSRTTDLRSWHYLYKLLCLREKYQTARPTGDTIMQVLRSYDERK